MQMKNLLRLMGALALTTGVATSVVACDQQTPDVEMTSAIKVALEKGVDGKSLDDSQKQSAAQKVIAAVIKEVTGENEVKTATFTFDEGDKALVSGENTVNIKVSFGESKDVAVKVKLTGVTEKKS